MKKITSIDICRKSHLPEKGWLQACFHCYSITGKIFDYTTIRKFNSIFKINVYLCPSCQKKFKNNVLKYYFFTLDCNDYIERNYIKI
tara:strand:- start:1627 stop:1887 length:261 start_codon:yes stop_codon:yes gene_type:complete